MAAKDGRIDARNWSLLAVLSVLWGGSFFFNGLALKELPPLTLVLLRVVLGVLFLLPLVRAYRIEFPVGIAGWKPFFAVAFFNNVLPFSLMVTGQTLIASGLASVLNATTPLFTVVVMAFALGGISGGAFNPAVGVGPMLIDASMAHGSLSNSWIYIVGPLSGGALAALFFRAQNPEPEPGSAIPGAPPGEQRVKAGEFTAPRPGGAATK